MGRLLQMLMIPVIAFSWLAGPIGGVWLLVRGDWWALGYALVALVVSHWLIAIALMPGLLLAAPAVAAMERKPRFAVALGIPALAYTAALMTVWSMLVLLFFLSKANVHNWVPVLLLAYSVASGPWVWLAGKEAQGGRGDGQAVATFFLNLALMVVCVMLFLDRSRPVTQLWIAFGAVMAVQVCVAARMAKDAIKAEPEEVAFTNTV